MAVSRAFIVVDYDDESGAVDLHTYGTDGSWSLEYADQMTEILTTDEAYKAAMLVLVSEGKAVLTEGAKSDDAG